MTSEGVSKRNSYRVGAVIFKKKKPLTARANSRKTHRFLSSYTDYPCLHAETNAIIAHGIDNCDGCDILVVRINKKNKPTMAKPCFTCEQVIKDAGIRRVYYTDWDGMIKCE
jgi:deoxycytidylate deaminase